MHIVEHIPAGFYSSNDRPTSTSAFVYESPTKKESTNSCRMLLPVLSLTLFVDSFFVEATLFVGETS